MMTQRRRTVVLIAVGASALLAISPARAVAAEDAPGPDAPAPASAPAYPASAIAAAGAASRPARPAPDPLLAILLNPVQPLGGLVLGQLVIPPEIQLRLMRYIGISITPQFVYLFDRPAGIDVYGGGLSLGLRILPLGKGLRDLYVVPRVELVHVVGTAGPTRITSTALSTTLEIGYAWIWSHFIVNLGAGAGYRAAVAGDISLAGIQHLQIVLNASLGVSL